MLRVICLVKCFKQIHFRIAAEQLLQIAQSAFGKLLSQQTPISVLNLKESRQVISLMLHKANKAAVD